MRIKVSYPSGNVLHLSGIWKGPGNVNGTCIILILIDKNCVVPGGAMVTANSAFIGDPRSVYQEEDTGRVLYNPRDAIEGMDKWAVDWLKANSSWPGILEL